MADINNIRSVSVPSIGTLPLAEKPGTFTPSGESRSWRKGRLPQHGGTESSSSPAVLDLNLNMIAGVDMDAINAIKEEVITVRLQSGEVHMMTGATRTGEPIGIGDGESKLQITAPISEKISG